jgi:hypothetical protein
MRIAPHSIISLTCLDLYNNIYNNYKKNYIWGINTSSSTSALLLIVISL